MPPGHQAHEAQGFFVEASAEAAHHARFPGLPKAQANSELSFCCAYVGNIGPRGAANEQEPFPAQSQYNKLLCFLLPAYFLAAAFFLPATVFRLPFLVREFVRVRCPRTGSPFR